MPRSVPEAAPLTFPPSNATPPISVPRPSLSVRRPVAWVCSSVWRRVGRPKTSRSPARLAGPGPSGAFRGCSKKVEGLPRLAAELLVRVLPGDVLEEPLYGGAGVPERALTRWRASASELDARTMPRTFTGSALRSAFRSRSTSSSCGERSCPPRCPSRATEPEVAPEPFKPWSTMARRVAGVACRARAAQVLSRSWRRSAGTTAPAFATVDSSCERRATRICSALSWRVCPRFARASLTRGGGSDGSERRKRKSISVSDGASVVRGTFRST